MTDELKKYNVFKITMNHCDLKFFFKSSIKLNFWASSHKYWTFYKIWQISSAGKISMVQLIGIIIIIVSSRSRNTEAVRSMVFGLMSTLDFTFLLRLCRSIHHKVTWWIVLLSDEKGYLIKELIQFSLQRILLVLVQERVVVVFLT